jgi:hypothetical protein
MKNEQDSNYISVGAWMGMMLVTAIPVIGWIMILVWAFAGSNESRKNYFRAILAWILIFTLLMVGLSFVGGVAGNWPAIHKHIQSWLHKA